MIAATLIATLAVRSSFGRDELPALPREASWLEVRGNHAAMPGAVWLRSRFHGRLMFALDPTGDLRAASDEERHRRLLHGEEGFDLVDLDATRDLVPGVLGAIPPARRVITWRGAATGLAGLRDAFARCAEVPAALYRIVPESGTFAEVMATLLLLKELGRRDVTAYASGAGGSWSRVLAPHLGSPVLFGGADETHCEPGAFSIRRLIEDYDAPWLHPVEELYGIVGSSVHHSLSPRLHNGGYRRIGRRALYLPLSVASFADLYRGAIEAGGFEALGMQFRGGTISAPHKEAALAVAGRCGELARDCNAANNFALRDGEWWADTTDAAGALVPLAKRGIAVEGARILVVGCGGAGRTVAAGLKRAGARVTLMNRGTERGDFASRLLGLPVLPLADGAIKDYAVVVNATPVGRDNQDQAFSIERLHPGAAVIDLVYGSSPTHLITEARARGLVTIDGRDVLRVQVHEQFRMLTGARLPDDVMDAVLGPELEPNGELVAVSGR